MKQGVSTTTYILWAVYISLLAVLLPHTAWAFKNFEPSGAETWEVAFGITASDFVAYVAAFAFEAAIAVLTHKLAKHIEDTPKYKKGLRRFFYQYFNALSFALVIATAVSTLANIAHAVQFGQSMKIFDEWGIPFGVYTVAFGGILPLVSLTFARVLSNVVEDEEAPNPDLLKANETISELRKQLRESEHGRKSAEERAKTAEDRFGAMGDLVKRLFGDDKRQRILIARQQWKQLPNSAIAVIAEASPSYVSEVLSSVE